MSTKVTVAGRFDCPHFHQSVTIAKHLAESHPDQISIEILQFFETQWHFYLKKTANEQKGVFYEHDAASPLIQLNGCEYVGDHDDFAKWALFNFNYNGPEEANSIATYEQMAKQACSKQFNSTPGRKYAFIDFKWNEFGQECNSKVVFELFADIAPRTCENFFQLCQGWTCPQTEEKIGYAHGSGNKINRIVKGMYI